MRPAIAKASAILLALAAASCTAPPPQATATAPQAQSGIRTVATHDVPVPNTVSPQMQAIIAQPLNPTWNVVPQSSAEWKALIDKAAADTVRTLPAIRAALHVTVTPTVIAG